MQSPTLWPERLLSAEQERENPSVSSASSVVKPLFPCHSVPFRGTAPPRFRVFRLFRGGHRPSSVVAALPLWALPWFAAPVPQPERPTSEEIDKQRNNFALVKSISGALDPLSEAACNGLVTICHQAREKAASEHSSPEQKAKKGTKIC
jgi:hypothetical protein